MRGYASEVKNKAKEKIQNQVMLFWTYVWPIKKSEIQQRDNDMWGEDF